jgi:hypothetical protein
MLRHGHDGAYCNPDSLHVELLSFIECDANSRQSVLPGSGREFYGDANVIGDGAIDGGAAQPWEAGRHAHCAGAVSREQALRIGAECRFTQVFITRPMEVGLYRR